MHYGIINPHVHAAFPELWQARLQAGYLSKCRIPTPDRAYMKILGEFVAHPEGVPYRQVSVKLFNKGPNQNIDLFLILKRAGLVAFSHKGRHGLKFYKPTDAGQNLHAYAVQFKDFTDFVELAKEVPEYPEFMLEAVFRAKAHLVSDDMKKKIRDLLCGKFIAVTIAVADHKRCLAHCKSMLKNVPWLKAFLESTEKNMPQSKGGAA